MAGPRVAVVTGGSRGIGRGIVGEQAAAGMAIIINYRANAEAAEAARLEAEQRGAWRAVAIRADVADLDQGRQLLAETLDAFGRVDVWVNNAGVAPEPRLDLLKASSESWDRVLGTNLRGPFFLTQAVARTMIQLEETGLLDDPQIHFVTSVSAEFASVDRGEYCISNAGLGMVASLFALRLADHGIRFFEIRPGVICTDMTAGVRGRYERRIADGLSPIRRWGLPEEVGRAVAAIAGGILPFATGQVIYVDGGLHISRF